MAGHAARESYSAWPMEDCARSGRYNENGQYDEPSLLYRDLRTLLQGGAKEAYRLCKMLRGNYCVTFMTAYFYLYGEFVFRLMLLLVSYSNLKHLESRICLFRMRLMGTKYSKRRTNEFGKTIGCQCATLNDRRLYYA